MRYQDWWAKEFPKRFKPYFDEVVTITGNSIDFEKAKAEMFSPIQQAIVWETEQINKYMSMKIYAHDDILFIADLSFPGIFANVLTFKKPEKVFMFCHATSLNKFDYFENVWRDKYPLERAHAQMCNKVFVGSQYHQRKLGWRNTVVTYLPYPPFPGHKKTEKIVDVISVSRPSKQKLNLELEKEIEKTFSISIDRASYYKLKTWREYYNFVASGKVMLITAQEETFGYQIVDAVLNGCIPIAPNHLSYPELLHENYLYRDKDDLFKKLYWALSGLMDVPKLKCDKPMNLFYENLAREMKSVAI